MTRQLAVGSLVLVGGLAFGPIGSFADGPDKVATDATGREISRIHANADGSSQRTLTKYGEDRAKTVVREGLNADDLVTERVVEQFDSLGRLAQRKQVTVDVDGRERGQLRSYTYLPDGHQRVTTETVK